jgi:hypothetical protein
MLFLRCNLALIVALSSAACSPSGPDPATAERLQELRNLGKAFYENPTGAEQAVETFKQALETRSVKRSTTRWRSYARVPVKKAWRRYTTLRS